MAQKPLSDALKEAISRLPSKEKDKYLFRLIAKDSILTEQLEYQLLEERTTKEDRREELRKEISQEIGRIANRYTSIKPLISEVRSQSARITRHIRVTADKYGEIDLNLALIQETLHWVGKRFTMSYPRDQIKLYEYLIDRIFKLGKLIDKIHEDYRLDFSEQLESLGAIIGKNDLMMHSCIMRGLDVNELLRGEFPVRAF